MPDALLTLPLPRPLCTAAYALGNTATALRHCVCCVRLRGRVSRQCRAFPLPATSAPRLLPYASTPYFVKTCYRFGRYAFGVCLPADAGRTAPGKTGGGPHRLYRRCPPTWTPTASCQRRRALHCTAAALRAALRRRFAAAPCCASGQGTGSSHHTHRHIGTGRLPHARAHTLPCHFPSTHHAAHHMAPPPPPLAHATHTTHLPTPPPPTHTTILHFLPFHATSVPPFPCTLDRAPSPSCLSTSANSSFSRHLTASCCACGTVTTNASVSSYLIPCLAWTINIWTDGRRRSTAPADVRHTAADAFYWTTWRRTRARSPLPLFCMHTNLLFVGQTTPGRTSQLRAVQLFLKQHHTALPPPSHYHRLCPLHTHPRKTTRACALTISRHSSVG